MKILYISNDNDLIHYNHWYGFDLMLTLNQFPDVEVKFYGKGLDKHYLNYLVIPYLEKITFKDLKSMFDFDVIILANRRRLFLEDKKHKGKLTTTWIPEGFKQSDCLKIMIEGDYHFPYNQKNEFYNCGIKALLHRHKCNVIKGKKDFPHLTNLWFPCSIDTNIFYPANIARQSKLCFVGHYPSRTKLIDRLETHKILDLKTSVYENEYLDLLQQYIGYLNHSSYYNVDNAKAFEIIASGGILVTNECDNGYKDLFGDASFITYKDNNSDLLNNLSYKPYKKQFQYRPYKDSDILKKINLIFQNNRLKQNLIANGLNSINKKHTHVIRSQELLNIIKEL